MKKTIILMALVFVTLAAACQSKDKLFPMPVWLQGGVYIGTDPVLHLTWPTGGGSTAWSAITGKPTTLLGYGITDAAALVHNHSALYRPISYVPSWSEVTGKPTTFTPSVHNQAWNTITGTPVFAPVATSGSFTDLVNIPEMMELEVALPSLPGIKLPVLTQTQINALVPVKGLLLYNDTDGVLQIFNGTVWKIIPTTN